jgi:hypothetical protein
MRRDLVLNANPPEKRPACFELSFFNVMMAATYFRRAARSRHPNVVRDIGREYLARSGRVSTGVQTWL